MSKPSFQGPECSAELKKPATVNAFFHPRKKVRPSPTQAGGDAASAGETEANVTPEDERVKKEQGSSYVFVEKTEPARREMRMHDAVVVAAPPMENSKEEARTPSPLKRKTRSTGQKDISAFFVPKQE